MKILFLSHKFYPEIGGIEVNSEILATAFYKAGHDIKLITWSKDPNEKQFPFKVIRNPKLLNLIQLHNWTDVVFENNPSLRLAWPSLFFKKPLVIAIRTWINRPDGKIGWQDKLKRDWLKKATKVIAVSECVRQKCWPPAIVIGNPYRNELFRILPVDQERKNFVFLGRLVSDKGAALAIQSIANITRDKKDIVEVDQELSLTIIGDGPELILLKQLAIQEGIQNNIIFKGALEGEKLVACLNAHRFILVPSLWEEPFGNVALEGMACGCIPIVSDGGGLVDAVGNAGLVFKRGDLKSLTDGILTIISDRKLEEKLREAASSHLSAHHPEIVSHRYLSVIENAVKSTVINYQEH